MENEIIYNKRYIARFTIEAATPLKVGTGNKGITVDEVVATDVNGLPYIPGTSLAGVLRNAYQAENLDDVFGKDNGSGSRLIVSSAYMVGHEGNAIVGIEPKSTFENNLEFYNNYKTLALRDHVRINDKGASDDKNRGKFDSQVVFKGTRFVFEIELLGSDEDASQWTELIEAVHKPSFRLGGGTRKGFGDIDVVNIEEKVFDLWNNEDLDAYLKKGISFTTPFGTDVELLPPDKITSQTTTHYQLELHPDDFFIFSDGRGGNDIDSVQKKEKVVEWEDGKPYFSEEQILLPGTSIKGAIAHRTAFYYNKLNNIFADEVDDISQHVGQNNKAVQELFGYEANDKSDDRKKGQRGRVIISDLFKKQNEISTKLLNHVAIDRFTGGAIDGALFNEQVVQSDGTFELNIYVEKTDELKADKTITEALRLALKDIVTGMLPLGGSVMRGHGCFEGTILKDGEPLKMEDINNG